MAESVGIGARLRTAFRVILAAAFLYLLADRVLLRGFNLDPRLLLGASAAVLYIVFLFFRSRMKPGRGGQEAEDYHFDLHSEEHPPSRQNEN